MILATTSIYCASAKVENWSTAIAWQWIGPIQWHRVYSDQTIFTSTYTCTYICQRWEYVIFNLNYDQHFSDRTNFIPATLEPRSYKSKVFISKVALVLCKIYENVSRCVRVNDDAFHWFSINSDVKHGCVLSPTLFDLMNSWIWKSPLAGVWTAPTRPLFC